MMKNFKYVTMMAAALVLGFSSCSNNDELGEGTLGNGSPTKMTLAIAQPTTYANGDSNATVDETNIKFVDVYIYAGTSFMKRERFAASDFVQDGTDPNIWRLASGKEIITTTGEKKIYVGVNLPVDLAVAIEGSNPASMAQTISSASELGNIANGYAMFNRTETSATLVAIDDQEFSTKNTVKVGVARLLAKVVVEKAASLSMDVTDGTLQDLKFTVSNVNTKFFPLPSATYIDPNHTSPWSELGDFISGVNYEDVNANGTAIDVAKAIYATENTSEGQFQGDHTYVSVRGSFVPNVINGWDGNALTTEVAITPGTTFYKVVVNGQSTYFSNQAQANSYADEKEGTMVLYTDGFVYYNIFLNPNPEADKEKKFDVLRNTIYKVKITKINGVGDGEDVIVEPEEPITGPTNISVEIDVEDWSMKEQESELTGK